MEAGDIIKTIKRKQPLSDLYFMPYTIVLYFYEVALGMDRRILNGVLKRNTDTPRLSIYHWLSKVLEHHMVGVYVYCGMSSAYMFSTI